MGLLFVADEGNNLNLVRLGTPGAKVLAEPAPPVPVNIVLWFRGWATLLEQLEFGAVCTLVAFSSPKQNQYEYNI